MTSHFDVNQEVSPYDEQDTSTYVEDEAAGSPKPTPDEPKLSVATRLVALAQDGYRFAETPAGEPFAVPLTGPRVVRMLRGGTDSLRAELADRYFQASGRAAPQQALADALLVLEGRARHGKAEPLALRVAQADGALWLDLGGEDARAVRVDRDGWQVRESAPVLFRRTALTGVLPEPASGGTLAELWALLNVAEVDRPVVAAVLVAMLLDNIPHPVVLLVGEQGSGKSTAALVLAGLLDPSPAQLRKAPRDVESWTTAAAGSWVVAVDNLSALPDWLSDALCRAVTGDGDVRRRLYSDGDLHVVAFRRCVLLNGIDLGAVRDDLADRLVTVGLDRIPDRTRRKDADLARQWAATHPRVLGAVLDLTVRVLWALPAVELPDPPRMADFAFVLAAVDAVLGTDGLARYRALAGELAADAASADPVLTAIAQRITSSFTGTAAELLTAITPTDDGWRPGRDWPKSPRALTGLLRRRAPSLRRLGWTVEDLGRGGHDKLVRFEVAPPTAGDDAGDMRAMRATTPAVRATPAPVARVSAAPWPAETPSEAPNAGDAGDESLHLLCLSLEEEKERGTHESAADSSPASPASPAGDVVTAAAAPPRQVRCVACCQPLDVVEAQWLSHPWCEPWPPARMPSRDELAATR